MRILLAVDGSAYSFEAARAVACLSWAESITVVHALDVPKTAYPTVAPQAAETIAAELERHMREEGDRLLDRIMSLLPADACPASRHMEVGSPGDVIATLARQQNADLVVMGARGKGPIKERFLGSVSHRVLSVAACATLIVNRPMQRIHRILLALQGPEDAEAAVRFLASTPFREPAEVTIVTVVPFVPPAWPAEASVADATKEKALLSAQDFVDDVAYRLTRPGYNVRAFAIVASPIQVILNEAAKVKPDLILIGSHRDRDVARLGLGSTARAVLHQGATPVLVFQ